MSKPRRGRPKTPTHDLLWLLELLYHTYGMELAFVSKDGGWISPSHDTEIQVIESPVGYQLEDGRPVIGMFSLPSILAAFRLPDVPEGFDHMWTDPDGHGWLSIRGLLTLVKASDEPEMQEVWAAWVAETGDENLDGTGAQVD